MQSLGAGKVNSYPVLAPLILEQNSAAAALQEQLQALQLPPDTWVRVDWEDGTSSRWQPFRGDREQNFPTGYHQITIEAPQGSLQRGLVLTPSRCYTPPGNHKLQGINCFLPALRTARNWGVGDLTDLISFASELRAHARFDFIALNPLHAIHNRAPYNTSPYLPLSIFTRNLLYLDVEACPEYSRSRLARQLHASAPVQETLARLRAARHVDYESVARLKRFFLLVLYREFLRGDVSELDQYCSLRSHWLENFCLYQALDRHLHRRNPDCWHWRQWPEEFSSPHTSHSQTFAQLHQRRLRFYAFIEMRLEQQLALAQQTIRNLGYPVGLYQDLALATDRVGADHWAYQSLFAPGVRVGSPPDDFNENGQDWGFPALHPQRHALDGYRYFIESLRCAASQAGAIRLDHVMRLARLYWIPDGTSARDGAYVRDHFESLLRLLALESHRQKFFVVGEDLGTVPTYFRAALHQFHLYSYRLILFEREHGAFRPAAHYPKAAIASFTTHDLPTFAGWQQGADLEARLRTGQLQPDLLPQATQSRRDDIAQLARALDVPADCADGDIWFQALARFLAATPCQLRLLNMEELYDEATQQNLPGTTSEAPNWQHRLPCNLAEFFAIPVVQRRLEIWREAMQCEQ